MDSNTNGTTGGQGTAQDSDATEATKLYATRSEAEAEVPQEWWTPR